MIDKNPGLSFHHAIRLAYIRESADNDALELLIVSCVARPLLEYVALSYCFGGPRRYGDNKSTTSDKKIFEMRTWVCVPP
jgi:hypothetical protein